MGQVEIISNITRESLTLAFAVLHMGGWDFHCCIRSFHSRLEYTRAKEAVFASLEEASAAQTILTLNDTFGGPSYNLQDIFPEESGTGSCACSPRTPCCGLDQLYSQVYRDNYGILRAFHRDGLPVPKELQVAADIALTQRTMEVLQSLERETSDPNSNPPAARGGVFAGIGCDRHRGQLFPRPPLPT